MSNKTNSGKNLFHRSGFVQSVVLVNGLIVTFTAFLIFNYFITEMTASQHRRVSSQAGELLVSGISNLEDTMRLITSIMVLSDSNDREGLVSQLKANVPNLGNFDQLLWLYEVSSGDWQYKVISDNRLRPGYRLVPDKEIIGRIINEKRYQGTGLHLISDLKGMSYVEENSNPKIMARSFAFVKTIKSGDYSKGVLIGVSRAQMIFNKWILSENNIVSRLTIRDSKSKNPLYYMDRKVDKKQGQVYSYSLSALDSEWVVVMELFKEQNTKLLGKIPYVVLLFGLILTAVGTLFIKNNYMQSEKIGVANNALENKNIELQAEAEERERLNIALKVAERDNRAIIDSVSDVIFEADINGDILFLSASWKKITGFEIERFKNKNLFLMLYPADQEKQQNDFNMLVNGQKQAYHSFTRLRISDGSFRAIEIAISMIRRDNDDNLRVVGTLTDVEERRRAERALAEAEKKYRTIVENAAGGLYQLTPDGMYLSANPAMARILGYDSPAEMLRLIKSANGFVYPSDSERNEFMNALVHQGQINGYETQVLAKDGSKIWVRENVHLIKDEQDNTLYLEGSMEDITQRKEADIALLEAKMHSDMANRAKTEFISNMSHELRTPLNAIIGFSDIMKNELMGPLGQDSYKDYITDIHESGEGLLKIINEILDISKIEAGQHELNEGEFSLASVLDSCIEIYSSSKKEKKISITNEAKDMPNVIGEELSIKQVMGNIYSNAIKYTPEGGRITLLSSYSSEGDFIVSITDTGIGMSDHDIEKALSPFGQVDNSLGRHESGIGLGLPLAQSIMGIHGGRLEIISEKSIGTTVSLVFPKARVVLDSKNINAEEFS